ncbi:hypothetical protein D3C81_1506230 [compost metagenome]
MSLLGSGGEPQLDGTIEVFKNFSPGGVFVGAATMTLVDHDQIKEIPRDALKNFVLFVRSGQSLIQAEIDFVGRIYFTVLDLSHY